MTDALRADWAKLRTLAGTWWLSAGAVTVTVAASAALIAATHVSPRGSGVAIQDPTRLCLIGVDLGQAVVAVMAVLAITEEYGAGMMRVTIAAIPRREVMLGARAATVGGLALLTAVPAVAGCLIVGHLLLPDAGLDPAHGYAVVSIGSGPTLRAAVGSVLYLSLIALFGLGIGVLVRDTAISTGIVLGALYLPPLLAQLVSGPWHRHIEQIAPMSAGLAIEATRNLHALPISPWRGLGVLAAWSAITLLVGGVVLRARDA